MFQYFINVRLSRAQNAMSNCTRKLIAQKRVTRCEVMLGCFLLLHLLHYTLNISSTYIESTHLRDFIKTIFHISKKLLSKAPHFHV